MRNLKIDLYPEEVYIFTPKGEVKSLPRGATAVDFAYSVHTDVGNQCVGARINGKMVPLRTRLQNGDIVVDRHAGGTQAEPRLADVRRHVARAQQDQARAAGRGTRPQHRARPPAVREGGAALRPEPEDGAGERGARSVRLGVRRPEAGRAARAHRLRQAVGADGAAEGGARRAAEGEAAGFRRGVGRQARAARAAPSEDRIKVRGTDDVHGVPGEVLQPDPRRADRRLHHARQGRVGALRGVLERPQPDVRSGAANRRRMGQRRHRPGAVYRSPDDAGRGPQGHAGRDHREGLGHQHQHHEHGSAHRRRPPGPDRHDGRDQGHEAPREGDQVDQGRGGRAGGGADRRA